MVASDPINWRTVAPIPAPDGWPLVGDFYVRPRADGLRVYMLVRRSETIPAGGTIAVRDWHADGRWTGFRTLIAPGSQPWENLDLGEPAFAHVPRGDLLLYTATASADATRTIGLARRRGSSWERCSTRPLIGTGSPWGPAVSIDPSVLVERGRMYIYYGAGTGKSTPVRPADERERIGELPDGGLAQPDQVPERDSPRAHAHDRATRAMQAARRTSGAARPTETSFTHRSREDPGLFASTISRRSPVRAT